MDNKLFVDTWGWLTLRDKKEARHYETSRYYQEHKQRRGDIVTTDFVLDETFTLFFKRLPPEMAQTSMRLLNDAIEQGTILIEWITQERFFQARMYRERFLDKPDISFTDLTSMVVMQEGGITHILTGDAHFEHVNLGFKCVP